MSNLHNSNRLQGKKIAILATNANAADYGELLLPGGLFNPDSLRQDSDAKAFVDGFFGAKKKQTCCRYMSCAVVTR